jgi:PHD/YefM family antitoxin component YafN of YafNO toxin-antitoxin module
MNYLTAQEIKRRGIGAVDKVLEEGPAYVVRNNRAEYVVLSMAAYEDLLADLAESRLTASESDLKAGRVQRGSAAELMEDVKEDQVEEDEA